MSLAETFLQPAIWLAMGVFVIGSLVVIPLAWLVETRLPSRLLQWQWEHVATPLLRILLLLLFITITWPELYGISTAPEVDTVLSAESGRRHQLINLLFILSILLPLIPIAGDWHALTLPLQGITAAALMFSWLPDNQAALSAYWPGFITVLVLIVLGWAAYQVSVWLGEHLGHKIDRHWHVMGSHEIVSNVLLLILQGPIIIVYANGLGCNLA